MSFVYCLFCRKRQFPLFRVQINTTRLQFFYGFGLLFERGYSTIKPMPNFGGLA